MSPCGIDNYPGIGPQSVTREVKYQVFDSTQQMALEGIEFHDFDSFCLACIYHCIIISTIFLGHDRTIVQGTHTSTCDIGNDLFLPSNVAGQLKKSGCSTSFGIKVENYCSTCVPSFFFSSDRRDFYNHGGIYSIDTCEGGRERESQLRRGLCVNELG